MGELSSGHIVLSAPVLLAKVQEVAKGQETSSYEDRYRRDRFFPEEAGLKTKFVPDDFENWIPCCWKESTVP